MFLFSVIYGHIGDPFDDDGLIIHAYPGKAPVLTTKKDGAAVFKIHRPPIGTSEKVEKAISIESVKHPGYFLIATPDKQLLLKQPKDSADSKWIHFSMHHIHSSILMNSSDPKYIHIP